MSLLFAELGLDVSIFDPSEENVHSLYKHAKEANLGDRINNYKNYESLCKSLGSPKVFIFSLPHGDAGDKTVENLRPFLEAGDIIVDASNENWLNTQRRQAVCDPLRVHYIGAGVSGGYQSARHGPSISPGGDNEGLDKIMPLLKRAAAKDSQGRACVAKVGPGGSGHYTKCVHNFIEQGLMSTLCEIWGIMTKSLDLSYEEVGSIFEQWNSDGPLVSS